MEGVGNITRVKKVFASLSAASLSLCSTETRKRK